MSEGPCVLSTSPFCSFPQGRDRTLGGFVAQRKSQHAVSHVSCGVSVLSTEPRPVPLLVFPGNCRNSAEHVALRAYLPKSTAKQKGDVKHVSASAPAETHGTFLYSTDTIGNASTRTIPCGRSKKSQWCKGDKCFGCRMCKKPCESVVLPSNPLSSCLPVGNCSKDAGAAALLMTRPSVTQSFSCQAATFFSENFGENGPRHHVDTQSCFFRNFIQGQETASKNGPIVWHENAPLSEQDPLNCPDGNSFSCTIPPKFERLPQESAWSRAQGTDGPGGYRAIFEPCLGNAFHGHIAPSIEQLPMPFGIELCHAAKTSS